MRWATISAAAFTIALTTAALDSEVGSARAADCPSHPSYCLPDGTFRVQFGSGRDVLPCEYTYTWNWGDGTPNTSVVIHDGTVVTHQYKPGLWKITLTVTGRPREPNTTCLGKTGTYTVEAGAASGGGSTSTTTTTTSTVDSGPSAGPGGRPRFDGLYRCGTAGVVYFFRFYATGAVMSVAFDKTPPAAQLRQTFRLSYARGNIGRWRVSGGKISFSTSSRSTHARVDYTGVVSGNHARIALKAHSRKTGYNSTLACAFTKIALASG
jgi:hypothetical protein